MGSVGAEVGAVWAVRAVGAVWAVGAVGAARVGRTLEPVKHSFSCQGSGGSKGP